MPQICAQMFKSVKNRLLRGVLTALCFALGMVLGFFLVVYLSVPAYRFKEPKPFEGAYLYNPYQDMQPELWKKYHFHCHSRKFFGLTNGRKSTEIAIDSVYSALGYDHYGISDYMSLPVDIRILIVSNSGVCAVRSLGYLILSCICTGLVLFLSFFSRKSSF